MAPNILGVRSHAFNKQLFAIKNDGTLWAWGYNGSGQFGDGTFTNKNLPTKIGSANNWVKVACGSSHTAALKSDSSLWAWGSNSNGQLGDSSTTDKFVPTKIGNQNNWIKFACGAWHNIALKSDGTLWAWGQNYLGQLGDSSKLNKIVPTKIGNSNNWAEIAGGAQYSHAIKSDGTLWAWGYNGTGQLGKGNSGDTILIPIQVGVSNKWKNIICGDNYSIGLTIETNSVVGSVAKIFPSNNQSNVNYNLSLKWNRLESLKFKPLQYRIQLASDTSFANIIKDWTLADTSSSICLISNQKYYWRIKAKDESGENDWSDIWSFKTKVSNLLKPSFVNILNNSLLEDLPSQAMWTKKEIPAFLIICRQLMIHPFCIDSL